MLRVLIGRGKRAPRGSIPIIHHFIARFDPSLLPGLLPGLIPGL
ncbi:MAG TPA: hypothetical protein VN419_11095 [Humidesulfovibrio sp.]|nr:hypothetical protein [Humidesulfovibrio sp.]HWR04553.1 hypothetical protein [Humidesulfovibrio sp.]